MAITGGYHWAMTDLLSVRADYSNLADKAYFNYGGQGPLTDSSLTAMTQALQKVQSIGPFSGAVYDWLNVEYEQLKGAIAQSIGCDPAHLTLTENVTAGCNIPLWGLSWEPGDHILITDCEHPGIVAAARELARRFQLKITRCKVVDARSDEDFLTAIAQGLEPKTRLVIISHILWNTGLTMPMGAIADLCHQHSSRTRLLVDAAQSVGLLPLDADGQKLTDSGADYYAFTGHKWACGPAGLGGLYVNPAVLEETAPTYIGWRGVKVDNDGNPLGWEPGGRRYEVATSHYPLWVGLRQAIANHSQQDSAQTRFERICQLSEQLWKGLQQIPQIRCVLTEPPASGLVSFQLIDSDGQPNVQKQSALVKALEKERIYVRSLLFPHCIRACVHYFTRPDEIDKLLERIAAP